VPALRARVTDLAQILTPDQTQRLEETLARYESETGHQIAVLTVPTLDGEPIESFSMRVVESWKLGSKGADNGVLLVVAPRERRVRIEVGYGLEGAIPDAIANRVIDEVIAPHFRAGDYAGGIGAAAEALMAAARGDALPVERRPARRGAPHQDPLSALFFAALFGSFFTAPFRRVRPVRALLGGAVSGGLAWLLLASLGWAAAGFAIGALLGLIGPGAGGMGGRGGRGWGGPVFLPGGGGFGGGGGGGGFGGGGGGFGGGGASGSW